MEWREAGGLRWLEASLAGATAAFTTRVGGVSNAPFDGLNLGVFTEDEREAVVENRRRLAAALGFSPERVTIGRQVHGAELATHAARQHPSPFAEPGSSIPEVDGHVTAEPSLPLLVFVADCVPVALAGPGGVAMLHCGWRALAGSGRTSPRYEAESATSGLVERGVEAIGATEAVIGPSIGPCCYEVGEEVLAAFVGLGDGVASGRMLDLPEAARRRLRDAGVEHVESSGLCTSCERELFFSHRRDAGRTGRQAGLMWRHGGGG
jgi:purine-nucleoside/S-methyl-5'-thioadenosine phosphorylase / adenosine deaminase